MSFSLFPFSILSLENCNSCALKKQFTMWARNVNLILHARPSAPHTCSTLFTGCSYTRNRNNPRDPNAKYSPAAPERGGTTVHHWTLTSECQDQTHPAFIQPEPYAICITLELCWLRACRDILATHSHPTLLIEEIKSHLIWWRGLWVGEGPGEGQGIDLSSNRAGFRAGSLSPT